MRSATIAGRALPLVYMALCLANGSEASEPRPDELEAAATLSEKARAAVPTTWKVELRGSSVIAARSLPVRVSEANTPSAGLASTRQLSIALHVGGRMTKAQWSATRKSNQQTTKRLARLKAKMQSFACDGMDEAYSESECCYRPRTGAEKHMVEQCRQIKGQLSPLPTYYIGDWERVTVQETLNGEPVRWFHEVACDDCVSTKAALVGLLHSYEGSSK